mgnify:CR=1 FL=1
MEFDLKRGVTTASKDILKRGLDRYFNDGIRFGFFGDDEDPIDILDAIITDLNSFDLLDEAIDLGLYKEKYLKEFGKLN